MLDVYVIQSEELLVCRIKGLLDAKLASSIVEFIEVKEAESETGFNRFCDLTRLNDIHLSPNEVLHLADRRRAFNPNQIHVKSAFLATCPLTFGIASMYEKLLNSPRIEVRVWAEMQEAADWLGVKRQSLMH